MKHLTALVFGLSASLALAGCGDENGTGPDAEGRVQAFVRDDPDRSTAALRSSEEPYAAATFGGTMTSNTNVAISADGQTWIDLGSPNGITIKMQNRDSTTVHGEVDVPVGTYARVRLTLRNAQARLAAGGSVGGITLASEVIMTVGGGDGQVVIEKQVQPFQVQAGARTAISFELNSETWATAQNSQDRIVEDAEVQGSAAVLVRAATGG